MGIRGPKPKPLKERHLASVDKLPNECWEWNKSRTKFGYGKFVIGHARWENAHHITYEIYKGEVPKGLLVRHICDNPPCCNPDHLILGTIQDNSDDMVSRNRSKRGIKHHNVKLSEETVIEIRRIYEETNITQRKLAQDFDIDYRHVNSIVNRKSWVHI